MEMYIGSFSQMAFLDATSNWDKNRDRLSSSAISTLVELNDMN